MSTTVKTEPAEALEIPPLTKAQVKATKARIKAEMASVLGVEASALKPPPELIRVTRPRLQTATIQIVGISPYVQHAFSEKQRKQMEETQKAGQQARGKKNREPKDFNAAYENAKHVSTEGWCGIPAPAFRNAMISACKLISIKMTHAKLSVWVEPDGLDAKERTPLVRIIGEPHVHEAAVRNATGVADIRWRPMWDDWRADVRITWDEDQFAATDVMNLMLRAGLQVGIGEGRPDSKNSNGVGWGRFEVVGL